MCALDATNDITERALLHPDVYADAVERLDRAAPSIFYHKLQEAGSSYSRYTGYGSKVVGYVRDFCAVVPQLEPTLQPDQGVRVCCAGCNDGLEVEEWIRQGYDAVGFDLHKERVDVARKCGLPVQQGDVHSPPFEPGTFDIVFCSHTLEHCLDQAKACAALGGLLKPGGLLLIVVPLEPSFPRANPSHTAFVQDAGVLLAHFEGWLGLEPRTIPDQNGCPELHLTLKRPPETPDERDNAGHAAPPAPGVEVLTVPAEEPRVLPSE